MTRIMTFKEWMRKVNVIIEAKVGLSADDLPDYCYQDCYDAGETPTATARQAIRNAKD